jgi:hypothetical protein
MKMRSIVKRVEDLPLFIGPDGIVAMAAGSLTTASRCRCVFGKPWFEATALA